jgi:hypothetical protein
MAAAIEIGHFVIEPRCGKVISSQTFNLSFSGDIQKWQQKT